jgi:ankyrin repeat protein
MTKKLKMTNVFNDALIAAVESGSIDLVRHLLLHPDTEISPIAVKLASHSQYLDICSFLIKEMSKNDAADMSFENNLTLQWAVINKDTEACEAILSHGSVDPSFDQNWAIRKSSEHGSAGLVQLFLKHPACNPSSQNNSALRSSSRHGHLEVVKALLNDTRTDPASEDNYAIRSASRNNYHQVVQLLMQDSRVDPAAQTNHALRLAAANGHEETVKILLQDPRVDVSAQQNYAVRVAAEKGYDKVVSALLLDPKCDPSSVNNLAIRLASSNGHIAVVKILISSELVDPSDVNNHALRLAKASGHVEVVKELMKTHQVSQMLQAPSMQDHTPASPPAASDTYVEDTADAEFENPATTRSRDSPQKAIPKDTLVRPVHATNYSGIDLYELSVGSQCVMRRKSDSWMNATHILKVAGLEKGKRTRILERELHHSEHEKIQGGFGKYQGTWYKRLI